MKNNSLLIGIIFLINVLLYKNVISQTYSHPSVGLQSTFTGACMVNTCSGVYYDDGGNGGSCSSTGVVGNYSDGVFGVLRTFCPNAPGQAVRVTFPTFCIEGGSGCPYDYFEIINGPTQNSPVLIGGCGTTLQGQTYTSTHPSGCLTFRFSSDNIDNFAGWVANISCVTHPSGSGPTANSNSDCINATGICSNGFSFSGLSTGPGLSSDNCNGCVTSENFSNWYEFTIATSGSLGFTISPTPSSSDYDFALYQATSCSALGAPVRCSYAATTGNTGLGNGATDSNEDVNGNGWVSTINVTAGQKYYFLINEWSPNNGSFVLNWSGTATIQTPQPDFQIGSTTYANGSTINVCQNNSVTVNALGAPTSTFTWWTSATGGSQLASGTSFSPSTSSPGSSTYFLQELTSSGCTSARSSITINVISTPSVSAPNSQTICAGQQTTAITFSGTATTYTWSNNNTSIGLTASGTGNIAAFTATNSTVNPVTATISVTPTSGSCTGAVQSFTITVNPSPTVTNPGNQTICAGQTTNPINFIGTTGASFAWINNNITTGLSAIGSGNIASFTGLNTGAINNLSNIIVTPSFGTCLGIPQSFTITITPPPTVSTPANQTICAGASITTINFSGTATTYNWTNSNTSIGLAASGTGNISSFVGTNAGSTPISGTITVTPTSGTCSGTPTTFTITVNPIPTVTPPQNQTLCAGQSTSAINFTGTSGSTFAWTNNNTATGLGANGTGNIPSFVAANSTSNSITSTVTVTPNIGTCAGTPITFTITVAISPTVSTPANQTICAGASTTAINFTGTATNYNWTNSNTSIGLAASGTGNISSFVGTNAGSTPISGTITVTPTSGTCSGTPTTFTITVNPIPTVTPQQNQTLCAGQSTSAINFTGASGSTYTWTNNNTATGLGANGTGNIPSFVATNTTSNSITSIITVTPNLGTCAGTPITFTITVAITPTVSAPANQTICAGASTTAINFTGTATTYNWTNSNTSIGLGANGTGNIASFVGTNAGSTPISGTITVTPTSGTCLGTVATFTFIVNPSVTPTFTQLGPYCLNDTPGNLPLNSTNNPSITGSWNPSTVTTSAIGSQIYTFTPSTTQCANTVTMTITTLANVTPTFNQIGPLCQNSTSINLPMNSTNTPSISGTWNPLSTNTSIVGTNTYTFTPNANQCASSTTMSVQILSNPTITLIPQTICAGQTVTITPTINPTGGTYLWSNNQTTSSITVSPTTTTNYSLLYSINGCSANSSVTITANPNVNPTFIALGPYCQNEIPDVLNATSTNGITGTWNPNIITTATAGIQTYTFTPNAGICASNTNMNITVNTLVTPNFNQIGPLCQNDTSPILPLNSNNTPSITGSWNPSIISTSNVGSTNYIFSPNVGQCASNSTMSITVIASSQPSINTNVTNGCAPLDVALNTTPIPNATYNWSSNGTNIGSTPNLNFSFSNSGCYDISLVVSVGSCQSTTTLNDLICVESSPTALFNVFPNSFSNSTETVQFNNISNGATSYSWDFGDGQTSIEVNPSHIYSGINSNIIATLTAVSSLGCTNSTSVVILFQEESIFYVPNTFTPDEDEFNQTWGPVFSKGFDEFNFNLYVYNRWGEIVWESKDAKGRWDGNYGTNGLKCPQGIYTWKIDYKPIETDEKLTITGQVNLLR